MAEAVAAKQVVERPMLKFNRNYVLYVEKADPTDNDITQFINLAEIDVDATAYTVIKLPFTIKFQIDKSVTTTNASASIQIYNLARRTRDQIRKNDTDYWDIRKVILLAGYGSNLSTVFVGTIDRAFSQRTGVDMITTINATDCGFGTSTSECDLNISVGDSLPDVLKKIVKDSLVGVNIGVVSKKLKTPNGKKRGNSYVGDGPKILKELSGYGLFYDNGTANFLTTYECVQGTIKVLNSDQGLLNTPMVENNIVTFDMIFEPRLKIGQLLELSSRTETLFNGFCKVYGYSHDVEISSAECGDAISSIRVLRSDSLSVVT